MMEVLQVVGLGVLGGCLVWCLYMYHNLVLQPTRIGRRIEKQGIRGPPSSSFLLGNIPDIAAIQGLRLPPRGGRHLQHDWPSVLFPHFSHWITQYGSTFTYSKASTHIILTTDVEMVKQVNLCTSFSLGKPLHLARDQHPLLGDSILSTSGRRWASQRKIIAPEFFAERVKSMVSLMVDCTRRTLCSWESRLSECSSFGSEMSAEIDVYPDMKGLTADVIARACFGSNYAEGQSIFVQLKNLRDAMAKRYAQVGIPGFRLFPTKINREIWKLEKGINSLILEVVKKRAATSREKDLLQAILEGAKDATSQGDDKGLKYNISLDKFIVDNCKAIYFAGQETSAITVTWCLMLLAAHPDWQAQARAEVVGICKDNEFPDEHMLRDMKILTMVIQETLRLYPPAFFVQRTALEDTKLSNIIIPKGVNVEIPIGIVQRDPVVWGPDADAFNPGRFANGIRGATSFPQAYLPFGLGPRTCAGQHFAMAELKVIVSMVLLKFSFSLSPGYSHSPAFRLVVEPEHGVHLTVRKATR